MIAAGTMMFAGIAVNAQTTSTSGSINETGFGIKGGANFSTITKGDFDEGPDSRTSFYVGAFAEIPLIDGQLSLQPEVLYSRQGFDRNYSFLGTDYKGEYQLDYINVPVLAKLYIVGGLSVEAGPQFGFKVNEKVDLNTGNDEPGTDFDEVEDFDFSMAAGLSYQFTNGLSINGRYTHGFTEVIKDSDAKNSVFQVGLGFKF